MELIRSQFLAQKHVDWTANNLVTVVISFYQDFMARMHSDIFHGQA
jgi:hypothetical protein